MRYGIKTMYFSDASLSPELKQSFFKESEKCSNKTAVEVGSKRVGIVGMNTDTLVGLLGEQVSENEFKVKSTDLLDDGRETISIEEYQTQSRAN